jgi:hypothetical protein
LIGADEASVIAEGETGYLVVVLLAQLFMSVNDNRRQRDKKISFKI